MVIEHIDAISRKKRDVLGVFFIPLGMEDEKKTSIPFDSDEWE